MDSNSNQHSSPPPIAVVNPLHPLQHSQSSSLASQPSSTSASPPLPAVSPSPPPPQPPGPTREQVERLEGGLKITENGLDKTTPEYLHELKLALEFVNQVQTACNKEVYDAFQERLKVYRQGKIKADELIPQVNRLLAHNPAILEGFKYFLPARLLPLTDAKIFNGLSLPDAGSGGASCGGGGFDNAGSGVEGEKSGDQGDRANLASAGIDVEGSSAAAGDNTHSQQMDEGVEANDGNKENVNVSSEEKLNDAIQC